MAIFFQFSREFVDTQFKKKSRDLYISMKTELKYKISAIIKNIIKNKKTTGVPTSYQSRYFTNLD